MDNLNRAGLRLAHLNIGSLHAGGKLELLRHQLQSGDHGIFCISETWLTEAIPDTVIEVNRFNTARLDRKWSKRTTQPKKKGGGDSFAIIERIFSSLILNMST